MEFQGLLVSCRILLCGVTFSRLTPRPPSSESPASPCARHNAWRRATALLQLPLLELNSSPLLQLVHNCGPRRVDRDLHCGRHIGKRSRRAEIERLEKARRECTDRDLQKRIDAWIEEQKRKLISEDNSK